MTKTIWIRNIPNELERVAKLESAGVEEPPEVTIRWVRDVVKIHEQQKRLLERSLS